MSFKLNPLTVLGGNQGVVFNKTKPGPPYAPPVTVSVIQPNIIFFYDNEDSANGSVRLSVGNTSLNNFNGNFHFLTAIPISAPTGSGSDFSLVVGHNLSKKGQIIVNCANLNLSFSTAGTETPVVSSSNFEDRNCSAIPAHQPNLIYVFDPFLISGLNPAFNTVTISVQTGPNLGIQNDVLVFIYGDKSSLSSPLIGIIKNNGDNYTFKKGTKGNIYIMAFIQPSPSNNKKVVNFSTGDPETDSSITFEDEEFVKKDDSDAPSEVETGSKNKGCLSFFGLW